MPLARPAFRVLMQAVAGRTGTQPGAGSGPATARSERVKDSQRIPAGSTAVIEEVRFAADSPLEEAGFELSVPPERKAALDRVRRPSVTRRQALPEPSCYPAGPSPRLSTSGETSLPRGRPYRQSPLPSAPFSEVWSRFSASCHRSNRSVPANPINRAIKGLSAAAVVRSQVEPVQRLFIARFPLFRWWVALPMTSNPKSVQNGQRSSPISLQFGVKEILDRGQCSEMAAQTRSSTANHLLL